MIYSLFSLPEKIKDVFYWRKSKLYLSLSEVPPLLVVNPLKRNFETSTYIFIFTRNLVHCLKGTNEILCHFLPSRQYIHYEQALDRYIPTIEVKRSNFYLSIKLCHVFGYYFCYWCYALRKQRNYF